MNIIVICLAQILLSSILLFAYFKTRVSKVEEKLDIMFQLVQSHAAQQQQTMKIYENNTQPNVKFNNVNDVNEVNNEVNNELDKRRENLINVSDDSSDENDTSDDETDEENESYEENVNELVIGEEIKKISLNLEINNEDDAISFILEKKDNIEILSDEELNAEILEEVSVDNLSIEEEVSVDNLSIEEEVSVDNLSIEEEVDYEKFRVAELKKMCQEKELGNYKKLKKSELIDLLKKN
jgi:hypothetical protein